MGNVGSTKGSVGTPGQGGKCRHLTQVTYTDRKGQVWRECQGCFRRVKGAK